MNYTELKQRIANLKNQVATQKARVEQAQIQVKEKEKHIQSTYGVTPDQLSAELSKTEQEIQQNGQQILAILEGAGA